MFSIALRRSAMMAATRGGGITSKAFSTQAMAQVEAVEELCKNFNWADIRDEVKEIRQILNEPKTNKAIHIPEDISAFEQLVVNNMTDLQSMLSGNRANHDEVYNKAHGLKGEVKTALYRFAFTSALNVANATEKQLEETFKKIDFFNTGHITKSELRNFMKTMPQEHFDEMFSMIDVDGNGTMELDEFKRFVNMI